MLSPKKSSILWAIILIPNLLFSQIKVGNQAPEISISRWIKNAPIDKNLKGKFLVIDFWATWCAPCIEAVPHMNSLVKKYESRDDLLFLALTKEKEDKVKWLLEKIPFSSIVVSDTTNSTNLAFDIDLIPTIVVIDNKNVIRWVGNSGLTSEVLDKILRGDTEVLAESADILKMNSNDQKKLTDSIQQRYATYFMDPDLNEYFNVGPLTVGDKRMNMKGREKVIIVGIPLKEELAYFLRTSVQQIILPSELSEKLISYIYKRQEPINNDELLNRLLQKLNLKYLKTDTVIEVMELEVSNEKLFRRHVSDSIPRMSRSSNSESYAAIENNNFSPIKNAIEDKFNIVIVYKNEDFFKLKTSITVDIASLSGVAKSLRSYGIRSRILKQNISAIVFSYNQ